MSDQPIRNFPQSCKQGLEWMPLFPPIPLVLIETKLPLLKITLKHQVILCFERALRLQESFNLGALASKSVIILLKKPS